MPRVDFINRRNQDILNLAFSIVFFLSVNINIKDNIVKYGLTILIAGLIGNILSYLYYPFNPIDFISYKSQYILNIADIIISLGVVVIFAGIIVKVVTVIIVKRRKVVHNEQ